MELPSDYVVRATYSECQLLFYLSNQSTRGFVPSSNEPVEKIKGVKNFDILGSVLLGVGLGSLVLVLDQGQAWGWFSAKSLIAYAITLASLIYFIVVENKAKEPVVDLKFFKNITFTTAIATSFISFMGMIGGIFLIPLFVQNFLGCSVDDYQGQCFSFFFCL